MLLPFENTVGAAAFRRGDIGVLVFDAARPLDLAALRDDPAFGAASVHLLPAATMIVLPLAAGAELSLNREPGGWRVAIGAAPEPSRPIATEQPGWRGRFPR